MRYLTAALVLILVAAACGDSSADTSDELPEIITIRASTDLAVGQERLLLALASIDGTRLGSPELDVTIGLWPEDEPEARQEVAGDWVWAIPDRSGLYRATVDFDRPGVWIAEVIPATGPQPPPVPIFVNEIATTAAVGSSAPASDSPTGSDPEAIATFSTDTDPDPRFYELSVAEAVSSGRPSVVVFATPRFCQTAVCGPTLEIIKEIIDDYPDVNFVHVEVYDMANSPEEFSSIEDLLLAPSVVEWGLTSEPWVFVVDADGVISGRFEGVVESEEIAALLG